MKATFSTHDVNSFGFRTITAGIKLDRFLNNPVITFNHDTDEMSVGKATSIFQNGDNLEGDVEFDTEDETGKMLDRKYTKGYMNGYSLGLKPIKFNWEAEIPELVESELIEIAAATVPSNKNAVTLFNEKNEKVDLSFFNKKSENNMKKIALLLALADNATEADIEKAIGELKTNAAAKEAELTQLSAELAALKEADKVEKNKRLELALGNSKKNLSDAQKANYRKLAENNLDTVINLVNDLPEVISLRTVPGSAGTDKHAGKGFNQLMKEDSAYLANLKATNYEEWAMLFEAEFGKKPKV